MTYATDPGQTGLKNFLQPSCEYHGLDLTVLSQLPGQKPGEWKHRQKDRMLASFLESVDDEQIILSTDAYDAWFLAGENEILEKYHAFNHPIVFSAERNCWPHNSYFLKHYPPSSTPARYLNSGGMIGRAGVIRSALKKLNWTLAFWKHRRSNQYLWSRLFLRKPDLIKLDTECRIFYCAAIPGRDYLDSPWGLNFREHLHEEELQTYIADRILDQIEIIDSRIDYKPTGTQSCHFHFNGPPAACMEMPLWDSLRPWLKN